MKILISILVVALLAGCNQAVPGPKSTPTVAATVSVSPIKSEAVSDMLYDFERFYRANEGPSKLEGFDALEENTKWLERRAKEVLPGLLLKEKRELAWRDDFLEFAEKVGKYGPLARLSTELDIANYELGKDSSFKLSKQDRDSREKDEEQFYRYKSEWESF